METSQELKCPSCHKVLTSVRTHHMHLQNCPRHLDTLARNLRLRNARINEVEGSISKKRKLEIEATSSTQDLDVVMAPPHYEAPPEEDAIMVPPEPEPEPQIYGRGHRVSSKAHIIRKLIHFAPTTVIPIVLPQANEIVDNNLEGDPMDHDADNRPPVNQDIPPVTALEDSVIPPPVQQTARLVYAPPFSTKKNNFGLYKIYNYFDDAHSDPDGFIQREDFEECFDYPDDDPTQTTIVPSMPGPSNVVLSSKPPQLADMGIFPNLTALRLSNWYWNGGVQKSQGEFQKLLEIIGDPEFQPSDISSTNWRRVNLLLGLSVEEHTERIGDDTMAWFDKTSWKKSDIKIHIPFDKDTVLPGTKTFTVPNFYHRSLRSVVEEKLVNVMEQQQFHILPHELKWNLGNIENQGTKVYGEVYTSPTFAKLHEEVQVIPFSFSRC
ncbi:hypothetical protein FA15DRAFT_708233 [Coprinopsis marcescibilis]|uniref:Uncharacterized protein n=1 Tax=Coprinopsis marcescibilis TaxID=230819 RepID=A0A5C3KK63_COPMA|nr:hypothetical protein FA15DRAFT_708233 [Coprinopsis marcescibilis]